MKMGLTNSPTVCFSAHLEVRLIDNPPLLVRAIYRPAWDKQLFSDPAIKTCPLDLLARKP